MKFLVTGITGRIGTALAKALLKEGHEVRGLVWPEDRQVSRLAGLDVELIEGSLTDDIKVRQAVHGVEVICHLAAAFQAGGPFDNEAYFEINVRGTFNMLEAAKAVAPNLQQFFFASSDALYQKYISGGIKEPIQEDTRITPSGAYATPIYRRRADVGPMSACLLDSFNPRR
ncbi:MAG: NAD(P)-dependent oxidoreductase, partial [Chloroflexota bacterium]